MPVEDLRFRAFGEDVSAGRMFHKIDDDADKAKRSVKELDRQISATEAHIRELSLKFAETGDPAILRDVRRAENLASQLERVKKYLSPDDQAISRWRQLGSVFEGLGGAGPELVGGAVAAAIAAAPAIGAAIGGAVLGGLGTGGIAGALLLASRDPRVQDAGKLLGSNLLGGLTDAAEPAILPVLAGLRQLDAAGLSLKRTLTSGFAEIAPAIVPLSRGIDGLVRNLGPGLTAGLKAAGPVLKAAAAELPEFGAAISDALSDIADGGDGAAMGVLELLHVAEDLIRVGGATIGTLERLFAWEVKAGEAATEWGDRVIGTVRNLTGWLPLVDLALGAVQDGVQSLNEEDQSLLDGLNNAKSTVSTYIDQWGDVGEAYSDSAKAATTLRTELEKLATAVNDEFDPMANLIDKLKDVAAARKDYADAVAEHGTKSAEARDAELALARAILAANSAAASASGTFDGKLSESLKKILHDGGLTEDQIRDVEKAFRDAERAGNNFAREYRAKLVLEQQQTHREDARQYRASGGPVMAGRSYVVGENGPELVTFDANGYVFDATATQQMLSGASGGSAAPGGRTPVIINFGVTRGDVLFGALVSMLRESVRVEGSGDANVYFGAIP